MADPLLSFLTLLVGPEPDQRLLEVRYRTNGRPGMGQHFISASAPIIASDLIRPLSAHGDTYVGVLLRDRAEGGRSAVTSSHLLWVEVDAPDAYRQLLSAPAAPTAVVSSGTPGHLHAYWLLADAVGAGQVAELNRKLAGAVGGDLASVDAARILRAPATFNHKHQPPVLTALELLDRSRVYNATELTAGLLDPRPKPIYTAPVAKRRPAGARAPWWRRVDEQLRQIPSAEYVPRLSGQQLTAEGKISCPFHADGQERTPSLQVYPPFEWACFGCQRGGSIYDFGSHLWAIPTKGRAFRELRDRLADVYGIAAKDEPTETQTPVPAGTSRQGAEPMAMPHEHDGAHEAIENFLKEGIMLVTQYAKHHKAQRLAAQTEAARQDHELKIAGHQERFQQDLAAKLGLEQASAAIRYGQVGKQEFWDNADAPTILDTFKDAEMHADQDPNAAEAVGAMADYMKVHMGIDVGEISKASEAADAVEPGEVDQAYADHLDRGDELTGSDEQWGSIDAELAESNGQTMGEFKSIVNERFGGDAADPALDSLSDLHLSKALTAAASPHTIDQVADAAEANAETVYARHTGPEVVLAGERDNLDR